MLDIVLDTLLDILKLIPFLFVVFIIMEYLEHKLKNKNKKVMSKSGKYGPFIGSILGAFPQCGFSVAATNLYVCRVISLGTLISIYLSTSDEMLPIMLSNKVEINFILYVLVIKIIIGMLCGFVIDLFLRKKEIKTNRITSFCNEEHCDCEHGILKSALFHTLNISFFILIVEFILNMGIHFLGEDNISKLLMSDSIFGSFVTSLLGLIPNCASSVIITELFINETIRFGSLIGGLLTGSGVAFVVLFKEHKNFKENIFILLLVYLIGALSGVIINLLSLI
ncbi:MAG: putative manganese transporter [Bacilli bacterium]